MNCWLRLHNYQIIWLIDFYFYLLAFDFIILDTFIGIDRVPLWFVNFWEFFAHTATILNFLGLAISIGEVLIFEIVWALDRMHHVLKMLAFVAKGDRIQFLGWLGQLMVKGKTKGLGLRMVGAAWDFSSVQNFSIMLLHIAIVDVEAYFLGRRGRTRRNWTALRYLLIKLDHNLFNHIIL